MGFFFFFLSGFVRILACLVGDCLCMHHRDSRHYYLLATRGVD